MNNHEGPTTANLHGHVVTLSDTSEGQECTFVNNKSYSNKIVLINRGNCYFDQKIMNAQMRGAKAVIIVNNVASSPFMMGPGTVAGRVRIPSVMISQFDGQRIFPIVPTSAGTTFLFSSGFNHTRKRDASFDGSKLFRIWECTCHLHLD